MPLRMVRALARIGGVLHQLGEDEFARREELAELCGALEFGERRALMDALSEAMEPWEIADFGRDFLERSGEEW